SFRGTWASTHATVQPTAAVARGIGILVPDGSRLAAVAIPTPGPTPRACPLRHAGRWGEQDAPHGAEGLKSLLQRERVQVHPLVEQALQALWTYLLGHTSPITPPHPRGKPHDALAVGPGGGHSVLA